jgi:hypothetical protein
MTQLDPQTIQMLTQAVLAALRERGVVGGSPSASGPVHIHPPIGTCTGDYSKFPELQGKLNSATQADAPAARGLAGFAPIPQPPPAPPEPLALTGIVTASQLQSVMDSAPDGIAVLAHDARLSPLANDLARSKPNKVRRASTAAPGSQNTTSAASLTWAWWIDGKCPVVEKIVAERAGRLRPLTSSKASAQLASVVRELAAAVRARQIAGGILFVPSAARATCLANRCASLRAIVGTCGEAVEQGINELGANVLIVEYPHHGYRSNAGMVDRFIGQPPAPSAAVERDLADLHRCG